MLVGFVRLGDILIWQDRMNICVWESSVAACGSLMRSLGRLVCIDMITTVQGTRMDGL